MMMMYLCYSSLLAICIALPFASSSTTGGNSDTCISPSSLKYIEKALSNISDQLKLSSSSASVGESLTGVTSLLQLSLLKELLGEYKQGSSNSTTDSNEQGVALLKRIELILNTSIADLTTRLSVIESRQQQIPLAINSLQSQVSSLSSDIKKITKLLVTHTNISNNYDEDEAPSSPLLSSCEAILNKWPSSPSGYYTLADTHGHARHVYCHMDSLCNSGGGWRRVASLNMTDTSEKCPNEFRLYTAQGGVVRACGRPVTSSGSCVGITFPSGDIEYSQVCGKVIGYQFGAPDGAYGSNINSQYADGVSLTHGNPRRHIWTFISGQRDRYSWSRCPCSSLDPTTTPSFVGSDYYCESGCHDAAAVGEKFYSTDRLWDGQDCGSSETVCCQRTLIPWFHKSLGYSTTDYIEMRICLNEGTHDEDAPVEQYEIFVK